MQRFTDKFSGDAIPPRGVPADSLAWIDFGYGQMYLSRQYEWVDESDPGAARMINSFVDYLSPGPSLGSLLAYHCNFVAAFYKHKYPVYQRIVEEFGNEEVIY